MRYLLCPDCGKKGAFFRFAPYGEDHYRCRYCSFAAFNDNEFEDDKIKRIALAKVNPDADIWIE